MKVTCMPMVLIDVAAPGNGPDPSDEPTLRLHPGQRTAVTGVEPEDLSRFEGEGGLEAPEPAGPSSCRME